MTQEEELTKLKEQLRDVLKQLGAVSEHLSQVKERESQLLEQLRVEQAEKHLLQESKASAYKGIEELEKQKTPPPSFVKANVKKPQAGEKQPRKKRDAKHNRARRREAPVLIRACLRLSKRPHGVRTSTPSSRSCGSCAAPYAHTSSPLHTLCERVERFLPKLFVIVAVPEVPAHNTLAARSVRPLVIARKISGGTRRPQGS